jgi:hypothetical protein
MAGGPEELILHVPGSRELEPGTGALLIAAMQASPHKDIEIEPACEPMPVRAVALLGK